MAEKKSIELSDTQDIPTVTFKTKHGSLHASSNVNKHAKCGGICLLQIIDILLSDLISTKPVVYNFANQNFKMILTAGTVISKRNIKENKINIEVDDGSGVISCIIENTEADKELHLNINNTYQISSNKEVMNKEDLMSFVDTYDEELPETVAKKHGLFLTTVTKIFSDKFRKQIKQEIPLNEDIDIGDNIVVIGSVADYMDQRLIFVQNFKRMNNFIEFLDYKMKINRNKNLLLKSYISEL